MRIPSMNRFGGLALVIAALCWPVARASLANAQASDSVATNREPSVIDSTARPVTLAEALALARRNSPQAIQADGQIRTSRAAMRSSYASFIPSLSLSAGATRQSSTGRTRVEDGQVITVPIDPWSYNTGLGASLELFDGGRRFFDLRQARAGVVSALAGQLEQKYAVELTVKQQYYEVLAAREAEQAAQAQLEQADQQRRTAIVRVRSGSATKSDSLRAEIQINNARLAMLQAQNDIRGANASLTRAIGAEQLVTASGTDVGDGGVAFDETTLEALAANGPAVTGAKAQLDAARAVRTSSWTGYLPSLTASWSRGGSGSGDDLLFGPGDLSYNGSFRLGLSLPLFNQLGREEQIVRADVAADNAEAALRDARLGARENLTRYLGDYHLAEQRVQGQVSSVAAAEEDLRVTQRRYSVGGGTQLDVLTSQTLLDQAREALIRARYDLRIARAQLEALVGHDLGS